MKNEFTIVAAYQWNNENIEKSNSSYAIKTLIDYIKSRFSGEKSDRYKYNISYRRLRGSAGNTLLSSIVTRIYSAQVVIIDLSDGNNNVYIEAGIAISLLIQRQELYSVYFIREQKSEFPLPEGIPSDLHGYFISEYSINNKKEVQFKDSNSLRMSIESDIKTYFNVRSEYFEQINEIE
jgi:hypothetical protein